jgi:hypothetical protein
MRRVRLCLPSAVFQTAKDNGHRDATGRLVRDFHDTLGTRITITMGRDKEERESKKEKAKQKSLRGNGRADALAATRLKPSDILYTYSKVLPYFSGCGRTLQHTLDEIKSGRLKPGDLPAMSVIGAEVDPSVGMSKATKAQAEMAKARDTDGWSSDEDDGRGRGKGGKKKRGGGGGGNRGGAEKGGDKPTPKVMKFFSTNNRRLWVLRECERLGLLGPDGTVAVRLQRADVSKRMVEKGTRSFRIERCADEVVLVKVDKMPTAQELKEEAERNADGEEDDDGPTEENTNEETKREVDTLGEDLGEFRV